LLEWPKFRSGKTPLSTESLEPRLYWLHSSVAVEEPLESVQETSR
jgi:hypothetical protein